MKARREDLAPAIFAEHMRTTATSGEAIVMSPRAPPDFTVFSGHRMNNQSSRQWDAARQSSGLYGGRDSRGMGLGER